MHFILRLYVIGSVHSVRLSHLFSLLFSTVTHSLCVCVCVRFIYLWLPWVSVAVQGPLPVVVSKACSLMSVNSLPIVVISLVKSVGSSAHGPQ